MNEEGGTFHALKPRARLMLTIGSELISSPSVAISELVKNSYDADASCVLVALEDRDDGSSELIVLDDGIGMTPAVVTGTWLEPATAFRRRNTRTDSGRRVLGEKGVGRFATAKLADELELTTRGVRAPTETVVSLDWRDFESEQLYLDEVEVRIAVAEPVAFVAQGPIAKRWEQALGDLEVTNAKPRAAQGTLLRMTGLRDVWSLQLAQDVQRVLQRLVSPFERADAHASGREFAIFLNLPARFEGLSGPIGPAEELARPPYLLEASVDADGRAEVSIQLEGEAVRHETVRVKGANGGRPTTGPFKVLLRVFDRDGGSLRDLAPELDPKVLRKEIDQASGISIYRNGFRVLPYGELGDDWLGLDLRRVNNPTLRISNNQVIGYVSITRESNPNLRDQSNREGLVERPELADLRQGVIQLVARLETLRRVKRSAASKKRRTGGLFERRGIVELRRVAEGSTSKKLQTAVNQAVKEIEDADDEIREQLARYQRLATLGALVDRFIHEAAQPLASIRTAARNAVETIEDAGHGRSESSATLAALETDIRLIRKQSGVLAELLNRYRPFGGRRRGRPHIITVEQAANDAIKVLATDAKAVGATVNGPSGKTPVTVDHTELQEVLINLLTNSLYWVGQMPNGAPREVSVDVRRNADRSVTIQVSDTGPGVPEEIRQHIFDPWFSGRGGNGQGLSIASEIVGDYYDGEVELVDDGPHPGATFEATLRRRVDP